jgi:HEAT repeat protein
MKTCALAAIAAWLLTLVAASASDEPSLQSIVENLKSKKPGIRAQAAESLGELGPRAAPVVDELIAALQDTDARVQAESMIALGRIGPASRAAVPALLTILKGDNVRLVERAIDTLGVIGPDSAEAVPRLVEILKGDDPSRAGAAAIALARILPADAEPLNDVVTVLIQSLKSRQSSVRGDAARALGMIGPQALPALAELIRGSTADPEAAASAEIALEWMGPTAEPAVPVLIDALQSPKERVAIHAAGALGAVGPAASNAVPALRKALASKIATIRAHTASALGDIGPAGSDAVNDLILALKDPDEHVRREAAQALGKMGPAARAAVPALVAALGDVIGTVTIHAAQALARIGPDSVEALIPIVKNERQLRHLAVLILGELGSAATPATDVLVESLGDGDKGFVREVILTLARIGRDAKAAVPELLKILKNENSRQRAAAAYALANIGATEAVPELMTVLDKSDEQQLRLIAAGALVHLDPENKDLVRTALPQLLNALDEKWPVVRHEAAIALRLLGPRSARAVPKLAAGLRDADMNWRVDCLWTLAAIGPEAADAVPDVVTAMSSDQDTVRYAACYTAGIIGPPASAAIPALEKNLQDRDPFLQTISAWALAHISPRKEGVVEECLKPLLQGLKLSDPRVRSEAAQALALLGPAAKAAVPALRESVHDEDETVRTSVADALQKIDGDASQ